MAVEVNMARAVLQDAFGMSPRRIQGLWLTVKTLEREQEKRAAIVARAAQADEKSFGKWMQS
ncbi:hypothetical protein [Ruixingdingia sedimenti]|uniref:Uncharacterized protein n=1 Tax=Ruixingdingia sedimenti TaxID=3073604 RepID=A0ABU1FDD2_9RHOB|nr:hypothetical protein [Xinfangfangia sp. LG-4]MDR5654880.1 hypothetical protein [Xinfangfangia sp. LG-4]